MRVLDSVESATAAIGEHLGYSDWLTITQERVNEFADATGDHQWIHVDVERAKAGPFGSTIAHGYLTLSLVPMLGGSIYSFENVAMGVNYGVNKVRFPAPVPVGSKIRAGATLMSVTPGAMGVQLGVTMVIECDATPKPVCVAETLALIVFNS